MRQRLHEIIFEADTWEGKLFDVFLIGCILLSVIVVALESLARVRAQFGGLLHWVEWGVTLLFTVEYGLRIYSVRKPFHYITSFFGLVDLLAILPTYLSLIFPGTHFLAVVRVLRVLRIFRVLKLVQYLSEARYLVRALKQSRRKIIVFLFAVMTLVVIFGSLLYVIEGAENGFTSIPKSIYWAIVTLTTVGYGDLSPKTSLGQTLAAVIMIFGYGIIAVPTGIVTVEMAHMSGRPISTQACPACSAEGHDTDAVYCKYCGVKL